MIPFHHEMAQVPKFPKHLFFYCDLEATQGGETPICLSNVAYEKINQLRPEFVQNLKTKGVKYTRILPEQDDSSSAIGRGWQSTFLTKDKQVAEEKCTEHGGTFEWLQVTSSFPPTFISVAMTTSLVFLEWLPEDRFASFARH